MNRVLYSGYASVVVGQSFSWSSLWLTSGMTQLFGGTEMRAETVEFGHPSQWLKWTLGRSAPVPLATLFERKDYSGLRSEESSLFHNTSWGLAHWLVVDQTLASNRAVGQFLKYVAEGTDGPAALRQAGLDHAIDELLRQQRLRRVVVLE